MTEYKKNLVVSIDEELHQKLIIYCVKEKSSIKEMIIKLITKELEKENERK